MFEYYTLEQSSCLNYCSSVDDAVFFVLFRGVGVGWTMFPFLLVTGSIFDVIVMTAFGKKENQSTKFEIDSIHL